MSAAGASSHEIALRDSAHLEAADNAFTGRQSAAASLVGARTWRNRDANGLLLRADVYYTPDSDDMETVGG